MASKNQTHNSCLSSVYRRGSNYTSAKNFQSGKDINVLKQLVKQQKKTDLLCFDSYKIVKQLQIWYNKLD